MYITVFLKIQIMYIINMYWKISKDVMFFLLIFFKYKIRRKYDDTMIFQLILKHSSYSDSKTQPSIQINSY